MSIKLVADFPDIEFQRIEYEASLALAWDLEQVSQMEQTQQLIDDNMNHPEKETITQEDSHAGKRRDARRRKAIGSAAPRCGVSTYQGRTQQVGGFQRRIAGQIDCLRVRRFFSNVPSVATAKPS